MEVRGVNRVGLDGWLLVYSGDMAVNRFQRTREDHSREAAEDYVELIDAVISERGKARTVDLADRLGISHVTVSKTVRRLMREGLVTSEPYKDIELTDEGRRVAKAARERHDLVRRFLVSIGVPSDVADADAEGIEHHVSQQTLRAMKRHLEGG